MKILFDLFPAHLSIAPPDRYPVADMQSHPQLDGAYYVGKTRVIVTDTYVMVARDGDSGTGPVIIFREDYALFDKNDKSSDSFIVTESGKTLAFKKDSNCGCGSRLRGWNPFSVMTSKNDPTE